MSLYFLVFFYDSQFSYSFCIFIVKLALRVFYLHSCYRGGVFPPLFYFLTVGIEERN